MVVGVGPQGVGERGGAGVVDLHPQGAAGVVDHQLVEQRAVALPELLEASQRAPRGPAELGMVAFALQLGQHDQRQNDIVFLEAPERRRITEENRRVEDVGTACVRHMLPRP